MAQMTSLTIWMVLSVSDPIRDATKVEILTDARSCMSLEKTEMERDKIMQSQQSDDEMEVSAKVRELTTERYDLGGG